MFPSYSLPKPCALPIAKSMLSLNSSYVSSSGSLRQLMQVFAIGKWSFGLKESLCRKSSDGWGEKPTGGMTFAPVAKTRILPSFAGPSCSRKWKKTIRIHSNHTNKLNIPYKKLHQQRKKSKHESKVSEAWKWCKDRRNDRHTMKDIQWKVSERQDMLGESVKKKRVKKTDWGN